jgi:hypothetical protein
MIPLTLTPPEHYSADVAYRALHPLRPFINAALTKLTTGLTAKTARELFAQLERIAGNLQQAYASGQLDGSIEWKGKVGSALMDIAAISAVATPIQLIYAKQAGDVISAGALNGQAIGIDEANATIIFDQQDIDDVVAAINSVLEV